MRVVMSTRGLVVDYMVADCADKIVVCVAFSVSTSWIAIADKNMRLTRTAFKKHRGFAAAAGHRSGYKKTMVMVVDSVVFFIVGEFNVIRMNVHSSHLGKRGYSEERKNHSHGKTKGSDLTDRVSHNDLLIVVKLF